MDTQLMIQSTPNPNALKFVLNKPVKSEGNYTYKAASECEHNPLAKALFELSSILVTFIYTQTLALALATLIK